MPSKARQELTKRLAEPIDLTPERLNDIVQRASHQIARGSRTGADGTDGHALSQFAVRR